MRKLQIIALIGLLVGVMAMCSFSMAQEISMKTYTNQEYGFEISYPKGWTKTEIEYQGAVVISFNAYPLPHSVSVTASKLKKSLDLGKYVKADDLQIFSLTMFRNVEAYEKKISGVNALIRESTLAREGEGGTRSKKVYLMSEDILYTFGFHTAIDSFENANKKYFQPMLESFKLAGSE